MRTKFGIAICKQSLLNKYGDLYLLDGDIIMYFRLNENGFITVYKDLDYMEPVIHKLSTKRFERVFEEISEPYLLCNQDADPPHFKFKKGVVFHYKNGLFLNFLVIRLGNQKMGLFLMEKELIRQIFLKKACTSLLISLKLLIKMMSKSTKRNMRLKIHQASLEFRQIVLEFDHAFTLDFLKANTL